MRHLHFTWVTHFHLNCYNQERRRFALTSISSCENFQHNESMCSWYIDAFQHTFAFRYKYWSLAFDFLEEKWSVWCKIVSVKPLLCNTSSLHKLFIMVYWIYLNHNMCHNVNDNRNCQGIYSLTNVCSKSCSLCDQQGLRFICESMSRLIWNAYRHINC